MYNITLRSVRPTIVVVEKQLILHNLYVCVFVVLGTEHVRHMRHIVTCGLPVCTIFSHII